MKKNMIKEKGQKATTRPPVVVVLGHVDSGKTSLLDIIRKTSVAAKESGGITQHIGAYQIEKDGKKITFIDTPGHEAFSQMRSRGAKVADIAILVVDACEGVQPQTKEAILHIKKAEIPLIAVLNKIDRADAIPEKAKKELLQEDIQVESLGGKIPSVNISTKTGQGINEVLDLILLIGEMENLKTDLQKPAKGVIIESYLDPKRGPVATLILTEGILKTGDIIGTDSASGKIKSLENSPAVAVEKIFPSDPAVVIGFETVPKAGENFIIFSDQESAKNNFKILETTGKKEILEVGPEQKVLNLILKTDFLGSIEAIKEVLQQIPQDKIILQILKEEVGDVNESDVKTARSSRALILGFRVKINFTAKQIAERDKIRIITFDIIYDLIEGVRKAMEKILAPETVRTNFGKVKVLVNFLTEKNRQIVGGKVIDGEARKGALIEIMRGEEVIGRGKLVNLQKNKEEAGKVQKGAECGIMYEGSGKVETDDILVMYSEDKKKGEL